MLTTALGHTVWGRWYVSPHRGAAGLAAALAVQLSAAVVFTVWPFATWPRFRADRWAWYAAALAPVAWFSVLLTTWKARFGDAFTGALPLLLAGLVLLAAARARQAWPETEAQRERVLVWLLAVALGFITAAIPLQLEKQWITIGWALEAAALVLLWQRFDHPGLKYVAVALALGVTIRLVANPAVLGYSPRPAWRIINWLMYTYLVPAAALLQMATTLQRNEVARLRRWEEAVYAAGYSIGALVAGLGGLVVIFVWLNLAIADWFATGTTLRVSFQRLPARDLATSITWAAYALVLLALGVRRASRALRWVSLGLMMVTIGKVFLYDLGELHDLYRVGSLLGLAISLIVVSLAYQRFVLRKAPEEKP